MNADGFWNASVLTVCRRKANKHRRAEERAPDWWLQYFEERENQ
jgi:hypothetical protein